MTQLGLNTSSPYERLVNYSKAETSKEKDSDLLNTQDTNTATTAAANTNANANTTAEQTSQDEIDKLNATGELANATTTLSEKAINVLKTRLQNTEVELQRLEQKIKNLSTGSATSMKSVLVGQNDLSSVTSAGLAASVADMARAEVAAKAQSIAESANNSDSNDANKNSSLGKSEADKANIRDAMMRYLSVERSVRLAEMMTLRQQIAQAQGM